MSNVLNEEKQQEVLVLGRLGWSLRRIEQRTGVRRETASAYLKAAGIPVRGRGRWGRGASTPSSGPPTDPTAAKPANEVTTDPGGQIPHEQRRSYPPIRFPAPVPASHIVRPSKLASIAGATPRASGKTLLISTATPAAIKPSSALFVSCAARTPRKPSVLF